MRTATQGYKVQIAAGPKSPSGIPLSVSTNSLPAAAQNEAYKAALNATGGTPPYDWAITSGSLAGGLSLSSSGIITGTPSSAGSSVFTATVTDATHDTSLKQLTLTVNAPSGSPLRMATTSLPAAQQNVAYSAALNAAGGAPPYSWAITGGSLPAGLNLNSSGEISGTPTQSGQSTFTVEVKDADGNSASAPLQVQVDPTNLGVTWYIRPDGGTRYSANVPTGQCDGQADAPYTGTGSNQHCAFNDYRSLYSDGTYNNKAWVISGGDTVIVRGGPWRIGQNGPNPGDYFGDDPGDPYDAFNPTIPSGTPSQHTRILGENYAQCTSMTQLFGGYAVGAVLNLKGAQYVDVQCL